MESAKTRHGYGRNHLGLPVLSVCCEFRMFVAKSRSKRDRRYARLMALDGFRRRHTTSPGIHESYGYGGDRPPLHPLKRSSDL